MKTLKIILLVFGGFFLFFVTLFLYFSWGIWRSEAYELTGKEFPLEQIYATDISNRGRDAGCFIRVYKMPENIKTLLSEPNYDLRKYPIFVAGFERDNYTRMNWHEKFPGDEIDEYINRFIYTNYKKDNNITKFNGQYKISNDDEAVLLFDYLKAQPDTYYCGWYRYWKLDPPFSFVLSTFYFYVMNPTQKLLIMFGNQT